MFPWCPPVNLNMYPLTVYNHRDVVIMCSDWETNPPNILESDNVTFFALNYMTTYSPSVNWTLSGSLTRGKGGCFLGESSLKSWLGDRHCDCFSTQTLACPFTLVWFASTVPLILPL